MHVFNDCNFSEEVFDFDYDLFDFVVYKLVRTEWNSVWTTSDAPLYNKALTTRTWTGSANYSISMDSDFLTTSTGLLFFKSAKNTCTYPLALENFRHVFPYSGSGAVRTHTNSSVGEFNSAALARGAVATLVRRKNRSSRYPHRAAGAVSRKYIICISQLDGPLCVVALGKWRWTTKTMGVWIIFDGLRKSDTFIVIYRNFRYSVSCNFGEVFSSHIGGVASGAGGSSTD